jgi:pyruvate dehydrogenase E1 component alpha subunit
MNFAAVYETPTVFFCQNNGFAISYPTAEQMRSDTIAEKAEGYGMPGVRVDGNDVVAVKVAVMEAADRARAGKGPSMVEALTYRIGPHTTADDPGRYRDEAEVAVWEARDPLNRIRLLLERSGAWTSQWQQTIEQEAARRIEAAVDWAEAIPAPGPGEMFGRMFAEPTAPLVEQAGDSGHA